MDQPIPEDEREQSFGEEIANSVSHGVALVAFLAALPILFQNVIRHGTVSGIVGVGVFAGAVALLYLISTLYHALPKSGAKRLFQLLDHGAIFLLIAGTYTPITLGVLRGGWGWTLFGLVWGIAALGILLKMARGVRHPRLSLTLYLVMGWLAVIAIRPLWLLAPAAGLIWIAAGGLAYTGGVLFYSLDRARYAHFVWHLFVMTGTACHFVAVVKCAA